MEQQILAVPRIRFPLVELVSALVASLATGCLPTRATRDDTNGSGPTVTAQVAAIVDTWPPAAKFAARTMIDKYGPPAEATESRLVWYRNGPWKRTVVQEEETDHAFPMPHKDVLEQVVDYEVPPDKLDELAEYDGSVYVDRTRGELSARCDMEAANFVALNLAHEIIEGKRSVEDARRLHAEAVLAHMQGQPSPYADKLLFSPRRGSGFRDEVSVDEATLQQAKQLKDAMMRRGQAGQPADPHRQ